MPPAFPSPRALLVPALITLAIGGTVWLIGGTPPVTDDARVAGAWTTGDGALDLELDPRGIYAWAPGGRLASCGRWRVEGARIHLRETWGPRSGGTNVVLAQPGLLLGTAVVRSDGGLDLTLRASKESARADAWTLRPRSPLRDTLAETERGRLAGSCGFR